MRKDLRLFFSMFGIVTLLNVGYALLRSVRNTLAVADLGGSASSIPVFELFGTMPGAVLMTLGLTWLLNRFNIYKVFWISICSFIGFFLLFTSLLYPALESGTFFAKTASMLFFTMAELWKIALFTVLFWGLVNQYLPIDMAKKYYAPLMLGSSIGTILAGPLINLCSNLGGSWSQSLHWMMGSLALLSGATLFLFSYLWKTFAGPKREEIKQETPLSIWQSLRLCFQSKYLMLLAWMTIADYIAYALGEVIFLDILKQKFPDPQEYCIYMGKLSLWSGLLTAFSALIITPYILKRCRWVVASIVTPLCLLVTELAFFGALWSSHWSNHFSIDLIVLFGTLLFCFVRAAKYTLFDTSKELSFMLLPPLEKIQGKLVIDGMCSRVGRGGASLLSIVLIQTAGGVMASSPIAGAVALVISTTCVFATFRLGNLVEQKSAERAL